MISLWSFSPGKFGFTSGRLGILNDDHIASFEDTYAELPWT